MKYKIFSLVVLSCVLCGALVLPVEAQTNRGKIALSGTVPAGSHPAPGTEVLMDLTFQLEDGGGTVLYGPESQTGVPVDGNGVFHALLGAVLGVDVPASTIHGNPNLVVRVTDPVSGLQTLVPLSSSGYAHAAEIAGSAVSIADNSVGSAQIVDGSVGAADVDSAQVQRRVVGVCAPGQAIREIDGSGTVVCETGGGGGVTAVTASAPLVSSGGATPDISLPNVIIGGSNTAIGFLALPGNTGFGNTASGGNALRFNTTGANNTASGSNALRTNTEGNNNTASGVNALFSNTTGNNNTASGLNALAGNTNGISNTASGRSALESNTTGRRNTASGVNALLFNNGNDNTASGVNALENNTTGSNNTASGVNALLFNTTGFSNTASGVNALENNTTGSGNTASGADALLNNTTGSRNTASGVNALVSNIDGVNNTASGLGALQSNTNGSANTAIGAFANVSGGNLFNATAIGASAVVNASNKVRIGNSQVTVIEGQVAFSFPSDKTTKEHFLPVDGEEVLKKIGGLALTSWNFIGHDAKHFRHYGPMAQDFFAAFGQDGVGTIGSPTTINSGDLAGILMIAVQTLEKRTAEVAELKARLDALERLVLAKEALAQK